MNVEDRGLYMNVNIPERFGDVAGDRCPRERLRSPMLYDRLWQLRDPAVRDPQATFAIFPVSGHSRSKNGGTPVKNKGTQTAGILMWKTIFGRLGVVPNTDPA
jgi:hypothetical protein